VTYMNFTKIAPPSPNDPLVNEVTQLNNNWDEVDRVLSVQQGNSALVNPETALEMVDFVAGKFKLYDGTGFNSVDAITPAWTAWAALPLLAPIAARAGMTPRWRSNPILRRVQICGAVQNGTTPASFGTTTFDITANTGGIPDTLKPVSAAGVIYACAGTTPVAPSTVSSSYITVKPNPTAGNSVKVQGRYLGVSDGTSSLVIDGISWWY
jgi:hypothetical protein